MADSVDEKKTVDVTDHTTKSDDDEEALVVTASNTGTDDLQDVSVGGEEQLPGQGGGAVVGEGARSWLQRQSPLGLTIKTGAAVLVWRILGVRDKLAFLARHPVWTASGLASATAGFYALKPHIPALKQKALQKAMALGMKAFSMGVKFVMSSLAKGRNSHTPNPQFRPTLQRYMETQFMPILPHVGAEVDSAEQVGSLLHSLQGLKSIMKTATPRAKSVRVVEMFQQAVASLVTKSVAFAHLYALEQFVLTVLLRTPHLASSLTTPLEVRGVGG